MKAEPPPTRDVNRDSGTASANGGWLRRLVRRHLFLSRPLKQSYDEPRPKRLRSIKYADVSGYVRPENGVERIATMRTLGKRQKNTPQHNEKSEHEREPSKVNVPG